MRNIIVVCLVLLCAVGLIIGEKLVMNSSQSDSKILKVAFPSKELISKYEPTNKEHCKLSFPRLRIPETFVKRLRIFWIES